MQAERQMLMVETSELEGTECGRGKDQRGPGKMLLGFFFMSGAKVTVVAGQSHRAGQHCMVITAPG